MATTLAQLKAKVIAKLGVTSDDGRLANLTTSINAGLQQMATEYDWPWLIVGGQITTVAGQTDYALPNSATRVRTLAYKDVVFSAIQVAELIRYSEVSGQPVAYCVQGSTIKLAPKPDAVLTIGIEYVVAENVLVSDSDTVLCPDWYADLIAVYGALEEARARRDTVLVNLLEQSRGEWIQRIRDNIIRTKDIAEIVTRDDW